jgi:hypothetical protein
MRDRTKRLTARGTLKARALLVAAILACAATFALALTLLTYWLDLWGQDVLGVEITVLQGLGLLLSFSAIIGAVLQHSYTVQRKNARLEEELSALSSRPAADYNWRIEGGKGFRGREEIPLTPHEFRLLQCLITKEKQVCEYEYIVAHVWPEESRSDLPPGKENLAALVRRLRDKINVHDYIKNHPGRGYEFVQWEC